jgi:hypothetical protein
LKVEAAKQRNDRIAKKAGTLEGKEQKMYLFNNPYERVSKESRQNYKYIQTLITKRTYFAIDIDLNAARYDSETVGYPCNTALFSKKLFDLCLEKLLEFIDQFQILELPDEEKIKQSIKSYNSMNRGQLPQTEMLHFYSKLAELGSFKEVQKFCHYSRATLYRYKERFKKIGITETSLTPLTEDRIPEAPLDFKAYHSYLIYDVDLLRGIKIQ